MIFAVLNAAIATTVRLGMPGTERLLREIGLAGLAAMAAGVVSTLL